MGTQGERQHYPPRSPCGVDYELTGIKPEDGGQIKRDVANVL